MNYVYERRETLLRIEHVSMQFGDTIVLRDVNATVRNIHRADKAQGQVVGFLGPSGIGKTQLFKCIAGLQKPTAGKILINSTGEETHAGLVGVVAQNYPLFEHRTVFENLMIAAGQKLKNKAEARDEVMFFLDQFDLTDRRKLYPVALSGGQRQRAAIIQQLLCSDHFLLMDEPFSGLDLLSLEKVEALINDVATMDELNTIIVVTHDVTAACSVADTLWMMGRERTETGEIIPGAKIVQEYDLIDRDLCWNPEIRKTTKFLEFTAEVKERFRTL